MSSTYQQRFAKACLTITLDRLEQPGRHIAYLVRVVSLGQAHEVDGPFFTEEEADISAQMLKPSYRSAKSKSCAYQDHPFITPKLIKDCQASRLRLADLLKTNA